MPSYGLDEIVAAMKVGGEVKDHPELFGQCALQAHKPVLSTHNGSRQHFNYPHVASLQRELPM